MGNVRRATGLWRKAQHNAQRNPAALRQPLLDALTDKDPLLRHTAGVLVARHYPTDLPKKALREMLKTLIEEYSPRAGLPPIVQEYARLSDRADESELRELAARVEAAMAEHRQGSAPSQLAQEYAEVTMTDDDCHDLGQDIALAFAHLPAGSADFAVLPLVKLWLQEKQFYEAVLAAIALSFARTQARTQAIGLSATQQAVLQAIAGADAIWTCCGDTRSILAERGLPTTRQGIRKYLRAGNVAGSTE